MAAPTLQRTLLPDVPADVQDFALTHNVVQYLQPILEMTRDIFPKQRLALVLEDDPEIADLHTISVQVDVTGWTTDEMLDTHNSWVTRVFQVCPATEVWRFRIGMVESA